MIAPLLPPARTPAVIVPPRPFRRTVKFVSVTPDVAVAASMPGPSPLCTSVRVAVSVPLAAMTIWPSVGLPVVLPSIMQPSTCQPLDAAVNAAALPAAKPIRQSRNTPSSPPSTRS